MTKKRKNGIVFLIIMKGSYVLKIFTSSTGGPFLLFFIFLPVLFIPLGCSKEKSEEVTVELPATKVLSVRSRWAVVESSHLRLRNKATTESRAITTLWKGNVVEIISRDETKVHVEGENDYWYQVAYDGLQGWVFGAYIEHYGSEQKAKSAAQKIKEQ